MFMPFNCILSNNTFYYAENHKLNQCIQQTKHSKYQISIPGSHILIHERRSAAQHNLPLICGSALNEEYCARKTIFYTRLPKAALDS